MAFSARQVNIEGIVKVLLPGDRDLVVVSGYAIFDFIHPASVPGNVWAPETLLIDLNHPGLKWQDMQSVAPIASLASITNLQTAVDAGWAVDSVRADLVPIPPSTFIIPPFMMRLTTQIAVRDIDGIIHRVAFHVTTVGHLFR